MSFLLPTASDPRSYRDDDSYPSPARGSARPSPRPSPHHETLGQNGIASEAATPPQWASKRKNVVFADPVAFRYLENDSTVAVVERNGTLYGFESYVVEQWACSRRSPTLVIVTYTGDEKNSIVVGVLSVPEDETLWSAKLRVYFKAIQKFHARPKETALGKLMVTNLSSFPSALTVIPVPNGDIRKNRETFIVNEDLKRLGCSGRSGLTLTEPTEATQTKFRQLYKTSDRVPICQAVMELIKLCQVALYMFEKLDHEYIDGLFCDMTEAAVNNWWTEVGAEHYNFEPTDGILGPSTVSALLGMLMGARNRLHWSGATVSKDVFDVESTKRGIGQFQKAQKLEKTRRLDRQTLLKLYTVTAKAAAGEGWGVQRAVKSTVTEIGGKRGEIVMGMVSGKDKGGLADIETLDLERFVSLAYGERPKWLWHGKPRRTSAEPPGRYPDISNNLARKDESLAANLSKLTPISTEEEAEVRRLDDSPGIYSAFPPGSAVSINDGPSDKDALRKTVFKSVAGKMSDARSGLGRIKDAVGGGLRGHATRPSVSTREDYSENNLGTSPLTLQSSAPPTMGINRVFTWKNKPEEYLAAIKRGDPDAMPGQPESRYASTSTVEFKLGNGAALDAQKQIDKESAETLEIGVEVRKDVLHKAPSAVGSLVDENDLEGTILESERKLGSAQLELCRRHSFDMPGPLAKRVLNENRWPRRMSFGDAEEAVLAWDEIADITDTTNDFANLKALGELARHFGRHIDIIRNDIEPWVSKKLEDMALLNSHIGQEKDELEAVYQQLNEACQRVKVGADELLADERAHLTQNVKEVEVLVARLDYEINAVQQKVVEVEDGILAFIRQVEYMESRAEALKAQLESEGWLHWAFRTLTGIGTGPNITRI